MTTKTISDYIITKLIGRGNFSKVYYGRHKITNQRIAVKHITKSSVKPKVLESLITEIEVLKYMHHTNIIHLIDVVMSERSIYIVLEYCKGGDLAEFLRGSARQSAETILRFATQLRDGLKVFNDLNIIHRDLKPQNILLSECSPNAILKIADFGFAKCSFDLSNTVCGSPLYMAPEVIKGMPYNNSVDLWSVGVIIWEMVTGSVPFPANNWAELVSKVDSYSPEFPVNVKASDDCKNMLMGLLVGDSMRRMSFDEFYTHPYFTLAPPTPTPPKALMTTATSYTPSYTRTYNNNPFSDSSIATASLTGLNEWIVVDQTAAGSDILSDLKLGSRRISKSIKPPVRPAPASVETHSLYKQAEECCRQGVDKETNDEPGKASLYYSQSLDFFQELLTEHTLSEDDRMRVQVRIDCINERKSINLSFSSNTNE